MKYIFIAMVLIATACFPSKKAQNTSRPDYTIYATHAAKWLLEEGHHTLRSTTGGSLPIVFGFYNGILHSATYGTGRNREGMASLKFMSERFGHEMEEEVLEKLVQEGAIKISGNQITEIIKRIPSIPLKGRKIWSYQLYFDVDWNIYVFAGYMMSIGEFLEEHHEEVDGEKVLNLLYQLEALQP